MLDNTLTKSHSHQSDSLTSAQDSYYQGDSPLILAVSERLVDFSHFALARLGA